MDKRSLDALAHAPGPSPRPIHRNVVLGLSAIVPTSVFGRLSHHPTRRLLNRRRRSELPPAQWNRDFRGVGAGPAPEVPIRSSPRWSAGWRRASSLVATGCGHLCSEGGRDVGLRRALSAPQSRLLIITDSTLPLARFTKWTCRTRDADYRLICLLAFGYRISGKNPAHAGPYWGSGRERCHADKIGTFEGRLLALDQSGQSRATADARSVLNPLSVRRFTYRLTWPELVRLYRLTLDAPARNTQPRYNICPTDPIDAVGCEPRQARTRADALGPDAVLVDKPSRNCGSRRSTPAPRR